MPKFRVSYEQRITYSGDIEARDAAHAIELAKIVMDGSDAATGEWDFMETDSSGPENFKAEEQGK